MKKRAVTFTALAGLALATIAAYFLLGRGSSAPLAPPKTAEAKKTDGAAKGAGPGGAPAAPVEVVALKPATVKEELQAVGALRSNESVILRPEVAGRIAAIYFRDGQAVKKGQVLIALDATLNEAEVAQARAELELARSNLKRTADLAAKQFVSGSAQEQAAANVEVLEAKLKLAEARLAKTRLTAPFDGLVGIRNVSVGDFVRDGADLVNIEDIAQLKVDFRLPERYLPQLKVGLAVEVSADALPGSRYRGVIDAINPRVDASGRSLEVRARLANTDGRLRPGMFARVRVIVGERAAALLVPEEAVVPLNDDFFVYTVEDGKARRVRVKLGVRRDAMVELLEGVKAGDLVVTAGMRVQRDGQPVRVVNAAAVGQATPPTGGAIAADNKAGSK
ncbi:MAG: efflux RND transporter periplasmic adaptor subunit [Sutterellaceae bacterium]|nr:efflux RND transporter periplasmic adaptor subunit [Burkholderiaceae bacterium]MDW8430390.1 efflux RND transporter periplasmic adaptor subunit [Sutterellaceae bacterium]